MPEEKELWMILNDELSTLSKYISLEDDFKSYRHRVNIVLWFHGVFKALYWMNGWLLVRGMLLLSHSITQGSQVTPLLSCYVSLLRRGQWRHSSPCIQIQLSHRYTFNFVSSALYFFTIFFPPTVNNKGSFKKQTNTCLMSMTTLFEL